LLKKIILRHYFNLDFLKERQNDTYLKCIVTKRKINSIKKMKRETCFLILNIGAL